MSFPRSRRIPSIPYNSILPLNLGDLVEVENVNSAYYGITGTNLTISEVSKLIDAIGRDDTEEFDDFSFEVIQNLRINVVLSQLPVS